MIAGRKTKRSRGILLGAALSAAVALAAPASAQTDCAEGNSPLDTAQPSNMSSTDLIQKLGVEETKVRDTRTHYTYTQDVMVQTLGDGNKVDGQFHEVTTVSYDDKGRRKEVVTFAEQSTLRGARLSSEDMDDIRVFMPLVLTREDLAQYKVTYAGKQHVDDLDTYVLHVEPKQEEKNKRYFQGRVWVDNHDFEIVKVCGKSVPDVIHVKKHQPQELRPTFVSYRQPVDNLWFPAYARVDDTLHFSVESVHIREIVKFTGYKKSEPSKP